MQRWLPLVVGMVVAGCATSPGGTPAREEARSAQRPRPGAATISGTGSGSCTNHEEVRAYMRSVNERIFARWELPPGIEGDRLVTVQFELDADSEIAELAVLGDGPPALAESAARAVRAAAPYPPLAGSLACLAGNPLIGQFRNPIVQGGTP